MHKAGMERGFAKNVKIDVCCTDFLRSSDALFKKLARHECSRFGDSCGRVFEGEVACLLGVVAHGRLTAGAKAAMQVANVRDFDIDAIHESSFTASLYSLSLPAFLILLKIFLGMLGSRYSQKLWTRERIWLSPWNVWQALSKIA